VQFPIARLELLLLQEQWVVEEAERVEDVEVVLLRQDEGVVDELLEASLQGVFVAFAG
jgi:hypothetical protein